MKKKSVLLRCVEIIIGIIGVLLLCKSKALVEQEKKRARKFKSYYELCNQWISNLQSGREVKKFFEGSPYCRIAIYGCGNLGNLLYQELRLIKDLEVVCFIDGLCQGERLFSGECIQVLSPEQIDCTLLDVIVVTAVSDYENIVNVLREQGCDLPILSLEDVICGV